MGLRQRTFPCLRDKMMDKEFDLQSYITAGVERFVANTMKATLKNPAESAFLLKFAVASKKASAYRKKRETVHFLMINI